MADNNEVPEGRLKTPYPSRFSRPSGTGPIRSICLSAMNRWATLISPSGADHGIASVFCQYLGLDVLCGPRGLAGAADALYHNNGDGSFTDVTQTAGLVTSIYLGWGTGFADFDNDGFLDLFVANGHIYPEIDRLGVGTKYLERKLVYQNLGNGRFADVTERIGGAFLIEKSSRGAAFGDYDNDGHTDVAIVNLNDRPSLLRNDGGNRNRWLTLRLAGTKSNRDAIGARVQAVVGGMSLSAEVRSGGSYISQNDSRVHFGLGRVTPRSSAWRFSGRAGSCKLSTMSPRTVSSE
ncbi:MAG: VCBS repeat-containing protein [Acidobacteria bacterium]|nr:VCBS repeat-containing protein [Acidobacteriota bacterium]